MNKIKTNRIYVEFAEGKWRKVATIIQTSEGGFSIIPNFNDSKEGLIQKNKVEASGWRSITVEDLVYKASAKIKLSVHADGFAHFSGEGSKKIRSGPFPGTTEARGIGLMSRPFEQYFPAGIEVFNLIVWGLKNYEEANFSKEHLKFSCADLSKWAELHDRTSSIKYPTIEYKDGILIRGYIIKCRNVAKDFIVKDDGREGVRYIQNGKLCNGFMKMVKLKNNGDIILAISVSRGSFGFRELSGYSLTGPPEGSYLIHAMYPRPDVAITEGSIDYIPS